MRHRSLALLTATLLLALTSATLTGPALADPPPGPATRKDRTPPRVHLEPYAVPQVGDQVDALYSRPLGGFYWWTTFEVSWSVRDRSGICEQEVGWSSYETFEWDVDPRTGGPTRYFPVPPTARTFAAGTHVFNYWRVWERFVVKVTDCAGNTAYSDVAQAEFGIHEDTHPAVTYDGPWTAVHAARPSTFTDDTTHTTTARRASASITFPGDRPVSLVMTTGPDRGKAAVFVDGRYQGTVDAYAPEPRQRVVMWSDTFGPGTHTLRLVNRATPGRPRIDLDLVVVCTETDTGDCLAESMR